MKFYSKSGMEFSTFAGAIVSDITNFIKNKFSKKATVSPTEDFDEDDYVDIFDDIDYESSTIEIDSDDNTVNIVNKDGDVIDSSNIDDIFNHPINDKEFINTLNGEDNEEDEVLW